MAQQKTNSNFNELTLSEWLCLDQFESIRYYFGVPDQVPNLPFFSGSFSGSPVKFTRNCPLPWCDLNNDRGCRWELVLLGKALFIKVLLFLGMTDFLSKLCPYLSAEAEPMSQTSVIWEWGTSPLQDRKSKDSMIRSTLLQENSFLPLHKRGSKCDRMLGIFMTLHKIFT